MFKSRVFDNKDDNFSISITNDDKNIMEIFKTSVSSEHAQELISNGCLFGEIMGTIRDSVEYLSIDMTKLSHKVKSIILNEDDVIFECEILKTSMGDKLRTCLNELPNHLRFQPRCIFDYNNNSIFFVTIDLVGFN